MKGEGYKLYIDGPEYQEEFIGLIKGAQESVTLHTYIFESDSFGLKVREVLVTKAKEGVPVHLLVDYMGSFTLPESFRKIFEATEGIHFRFFNPLKAPKLLFIGRRLHHKVLTVDSKRAFIGGINVLDGLDPEFPEQPRLDFALKLEGEVVGEVGKYCSFIFNLDKGEISHSKNIFKQLDFEDENIFIKVNDWFYDRKQITNSYKRLVQGSQQEIVLLHGYFFPSFVILSLIKKKAREGVKVSVFLPRYSDWASWVWATEHLYEGLIKSGVRIMEWIPSNLHGKMAIFDQKVVTLGSHNLNYTSSYGNLEMNVEVHDQDFSKGILSELIPFIEKGCIEITAQKRARFHLGRKIRNAVAFFGLLIISSFTVNFIKASQQFFQMSPFPSDGNCHFVASWVLGDFDSFCAWDSFFHSGVDDFHERAQAQHPLKIFLERSVALGTT